jgi:hypothetical protein
VQTWTYSVTAYDPAQPWKIISTRTGMTVELEDDVPFWDWAYDRWPTPQYKVELAPNELTRHLRIVR